MAYSDPEKKLAYNRKYRETHRAERAAYNKKYAEEHGEERRAYKREWREREDVKERERVWRAEHAESEAARKHEYDVTHRAARRAHSAVKRALAKGILVRPATCPRCGSDRRVEAHHEDYSKPLEVEWLCKRCHSARR